jgi:hypothetical protein
MASVKHTTRAHGTGLSGACFYIFTSFEHAEARREPREKGRVSREEPNPGAITADASTCPTPAVRRIDQDQIAVPAAASAAPDASATNTLVGT